MQVKPENNLLLKALGNWAKKVATRHHTMIREGIMKENQMDWMKTTIIFLPKVPGVVKFILEFKFLTPHKKKVRSDFLSDP